VDKNNRPGTHDGGSDDRISWHPAFFDAIRMELEEYGDDLRFVSEHPLSSEPLRIDVLIIKKTRDVQIRKNIAAIFRKDNIVEYKSPDDHVSLKDFYKVYGYACLYAAMEDTVGIEDITLTFVESRHPRDLIAHLREKRGYTVEEKWPGIYIISGDVLPIQVIDNRRLSAGENLWLKGLDNQLDACELLHVTTEITRLDKARQIGAYLDVVVRANKEKLREAYEMSDAAMTLEQILDDIGITAKAEARGKAIGEASGEARGEARGKAMGEARGAEMTAIKVARNLLMDGFSHEQAARLAELDIAKVRALASAP